jgi:outer membrane protein OmpA-like peptidoglycan-associated protein
MKLHELIGTYLIVATSGIALVACSSTPSPNAALNQAQSAYNTASSDPTVQKSAHQDLEDAHDYLQMAQHEWEKDGDKSEIDHNAYMAHRYSELAQQRAKFRVAALQTTATARNITLGSTLFATGKADLNANGMRAVGDLATYLKNYPSATARLTGYTDSTGSAKINAALSQARAESVKTALVNQGIDGSRLMASGEGPSNPIASNNTAAGRQKNRRVEVAIIPEGAPAATMQ